jgi:hypothetical protein
MQLPMLPQQVLPAQKPRFDIPNAHPPIIRSAANARRPNPQRSPPTAPPSTAPLCPRCALSRSRGRGARGSGGEAQRPACKTT